MPEPKWSSPDAACQGDTLEPNRAAGNDRLQHGGRESASEQGSLERCSFTTSCETHVTAEYHHEALKHEHDTRRQAKGAREGCARSHILLPEPDAMSVRGRGGCSAAARSRSSQLRAPGRGDADPSSSSSAAALSAKAGPQLFAARLRLTLSEQHQDGRGDVAPEHEPCEGPAERHPTF